MQHFLHRLFLEKINNKWYYASITIEQIPTLHKAVYPFGADLLLKILPRFGHNKVLGLALWQYFGLLILLLLSVLMHLVLSRVLNPIVNRLSQSRLYPSLISPNLVWRIARLVSLFLIIRLLAILLPILQLPIAASSFATTAIKVISTLLIVLIALRVLDIIMLYAGNLTTKTENRMDEQLIPILTRILQAIIIIGGIIQVLRYMDVNITALIAGVSIGGLALALAAQDTVKNLIGSAMIFVDRPFQIGDYIEGGGVAGTVLEVGFRTTRLKQPDSSIIAVPNGSIVNAAITNKGVRVHRLFQTVLGVTYDTSPELLDKFVEALRQMVLDHPRTLKDNYFVHVNNLSASSIDILFRATFEIDESKSELEIREELIMTILKLAEEMKVSFAFPSTSIYMEKA